MAVPEFTTLADCLSVLRLDNGDVDEDRITEAVAAANARVFKSLGQAADHAQYTPATDEYLIAWPLLQQAARVVALDIYRAPGAPGGVLDEFTDLGPVRLGRDPIARVWPLISDFARLGMGLGI